MYCCNVEGLITQLELGYDSNQCYLSMLLSLTAVLLQSENLRKHKNSNNIAKKSIIQKCLKYTFNNSADIVWYANR